MIDAETKPFDGYGLAIRTFWIGGKELSVSRRWEREWIIDPETGDRFSTSIIATAVSEKDTVCVIGKDRATKEFALTIKSDEAIKQEWEWQKAHDLNNDDGTTPESRLSARISEILSEEPPTATLFVTDDDWEIGIKSGWSIECALPAPVLAQLERDVLAQRAREFYLGIKWAGGLVRDEHAPPSVPTSWGLLTLKERHGPEPLRGHVQFVGWRIAEEVPEPEIARVEDDRQEPPQRTMVPQRDGLSEILAAQTLALTRVGVVGFMAALVLILISHFLR